MTSFRRSAGLAAVAVLTLALTACGSGSDGGSATGGDLKVTDAWVVVPAAPNVTGAFATIVNDGDTEVKLVSASSPIAGVTQIHETIKDGTVEKMQEIKGGLPIPAGGSAELKPGGNHVMLMDLKQVPKAGDTVEVTFVFSNGDEITVDAPVEARAGMTPMPDMSMSMG